MGAQITIPGFSATDRVPGFFGQTLTGQGPSSAQSVPLVLLCVGISLATGTFVQNSTPQLMTQASDADSAFSAGVQVSRMVYGALKVPGAQVYAIGIPAAGGAVAAAGYIDVSGVWTTAGTLSYRINGETRSITVASTDTPTIVATNLAADINNQFRWPVTAASALFTGSIFRVTITHKTPGATGNYQLNYLDNSQAPSGLIASMSSSDVGGQLNWKTATAYVVGSLVQPTVAQGFYFKVTAISGTGTSGVSEPVWPTTLGTTVVDNSGANQITWTCWGVLGNAGVTGMGGGTGVENVTLALNTIVSTQYDRIALGQNDATNLGLWKTQVDAAAGPLQNILEQAICGTNGSAATAQSLAQTTLNDTRFQVLRYLNCESHPCEMAAVFAAIRESTEGGNWAAFYDGYDLTQYGIAAQSEVADIPNHATLVADLNNGVTPVTTVNGRAQIVRAICTHSLNGAVPDYSTYDTSDMTVPDQIRYDLRLLWTTDFKPNNPALQDDPATNAQTGQIGQFPPSGVAMPRTWNARVYGKLKKYERGDGFPYPQIQNVDQNMPVAALDPNRKCIMSAVPNVPIFGNHQIGVSVRGQQR